MQRLTYYMTADVSDDLVEVAEALQYTRGGFLRPNLYLDHSTGHVHRDRLDRAYTSLEAELPTWVPLVVNLEHTRWITEGNGPVTGYEWFRRRESVAMFMRARFVNRLIGSWGEPVSNHPLTFRSGKSWTVAAVSAYWRDGQSFGDWHFAAKERLRHALPFELPVVQYVSPVIWRGRGKAEPMPVETWAGVCDAVAAMDGVDIVEFWFNQADFDQDYVVRSLRRLAHAIRGAA